LFSLKERPCRHGHPRRQLGSISHADADAKSSSTGNQRLGVKARGALEDNSVEYSLTQLGRTLIAPLSGMCRWAKGHERNVMAEVRVSSPEQS
jgi:hypothetical protein